MGLLKSIKERDPAAGRLLSIFFLYKGVHALIWHRVAHFLYRLRLRFTARAVSNLSKFLTGIEIHPGAKIGKNLFIDHGTGLVIGETAVIGDDCTLYQGVTLGGTGKEAGKRHPSLGNNVIVGAGAKVLGNITVGNNSKIAANAVVLSDIAENSTAVGVPARVVVKSATGTDAQRFDMNHQDIPDPIKEQLDCLSAQIEELRTALERLSAASGNGADG